MSPTRNARRERLTLVSSRLCNVFGLCCTLEKTVRRVKARAVFPTSELLDEFPQRPRRGGGNFSRSNRAGRRRHTPRPAGQARSRRSGGLRSRGPLLAQGEREFPGAR